MADNPLRSKEIGLNGKLITSVNALTIDTNFQELKNLRYTDTGLRAISGMSKINSTAITTYTNLEGGFQYDKTPTRLTVGTTTSTSASKLVDSGAAFNGGEFAAGDIVENTTDSTQTTISSVDSATQLTLGSDIFVSGEAYRIYPEGSHLLVQAYNSGETASQVLQNKTAIPNIGDFDGTALHTDASGASKGYFSSAPNGTVAYCNSKETMIWGGDEFRCAGFVNYDDPLDTFTYDYTEVVNNKLSDTTNVAKVYLETTAGDDGFIYVGSTLPVSGIKFYVKTANDTAGTMSVKYWDGSAWQAVSSPSDGTASGGNPLAQTGTFTFTDTSSTAKLKIINQIALYWYKVQITDVNANTTVYQCTVKTGFQTMKEVWNGDMATPLSFQLYWAGDSTYYENTSNVAEVDHVTTVVSTVTSLGGMVNTSYMVAGFSEPMMGIDTVFVAGNINKNATVLTVEYWNGTGWTGVTAMEDNTIQPAGTSFGQSGSIYWSPIAKNTEVKLEINGKLPLYYYKLKFNNALSATIYLDYVGGVRAPKVIEAYKFPVSAHNRLFLCSNQDGKKNTALVSSKFTPNVFNGPDTIELTFGDATELTAGAGLFRQYGSSLLNLTVFTKVNETWIIVGDNPEDWVQHKASDTIGCASPDTMMVVNASFEQEVQSINRVVAIWQGLEGIYLFDGTSIIEISGDISDRFDKRSANSIEETRIDKSVAFFDNQNQEYHWLFSVGSTTTLDTEMVYDLKRNKWYEVDRGTGEQLQMGMTVADRKGNRYNYGGEDDGYVYRLEDTTSTGYKFEDNDIVSTFRFGGMALGGNEGGSINTLTRLRKIKLVTAAKENTTNSVALTYYGDGVTTGTALTSMSPVNSGYQTSQIVNGTNKGRFTFHDLHFSMTTDNESITFEPLYVGILFNEEGYDLN